MHNNSFTLDKIFSDNMVLQRCKDVKIWGKGVENSSVSVKIKNVEVTAPVKDGKWMAVLPAMDACQCCELRVYSDNPEDEQIVIKNVAIGEVWVAGGQSNMEFSLKFDAEGKKSISLANNPHIRFYDCPKISYQGQEQIDDYSEFGFWRPCNPENTPYYSAVAFYFAEKIYASQEVPVGIIGCNWGGTIASTWLHEKYLAGDEELRVYLDQYDAAVKNLDMDEYERKFEEARLFNNNPESKMILDKLMAETLTKEQTDEILLKIDSSVLIPLFGPKYFNRPSALYHNMVEKISSYAVRGVIWYQGESDSIKADIYSKLFAAVIKCWRETWQDELPFLFVQLAPFGSWLGSEGTQFPVLRQQQEIVSKEVPKAYMASIMDSGLEFDIHPKKKRTVGERLAFLARNKVYGEEIISEAPEVDIAARVKNCIDVKFKNVGYEFILKGEKINGLQIFINNEEISEFKSEVKNNSIIIECEKFKEDTEIEIRFAWIPYVEVNLYSSAALPMRPFKIVL